MLAKSVVQSKYSGRHPSMLSLGKTVSCLWYRGEGTNITWSVCLTCSTSLRKQPTIHDATTGFVPRGKCASTNQKHCPDLGSDKSSVWNFCACFSDVISRGNQWRGREMSAVLFRLMFHMIFMFSSEKPVMSKSTSRLTHPIPDRSHFRNPFDGNAWQVSHKRLSQEWRKTSSSRWRTKNRSTKSKIER